MQNLTRSARSKERRKWKPAGSAKCTKCGEKNAALPSARARSGSDAADRSSPSPQHLLDTAHPFATAGIDELRRLKTLV